MSATPSDALLSASQAIRNAGIHESPTNLARAALAASGFDETKRQLQAVRALLEQAEKDAADFGRNNGCVGVARLRAALGAGDE